MNLYSRGPAPEAPGVLPRTTAVRASGEGIDLADEADQPPENLTRDNCFHVSEDGERWTSYLSGPGPLEISGPRQGAT